VFFLTGADENSDRNVEAAKLQGITTRAFVDRNSGEFERLCKVYEISHDRFIRTAVDEDHKKGVQEFVRRWIASGDIYKGTYEGLYCRGCEAFYDENELIDGRCPLHPTSESLSPRRKLSLTWSSNWEPKARGELSS